MSSTPVLAIQLALIVATGGVAVAGYAVRVKWHRHRVGAMYLSLFASLWLAGAHFLVEGLLGQAPAWVEVVLLAIVQGAILWNLAGLIQYRADRRTDRTA